MTKYTTCSGYNRLKRKCAIFISETDLGKFFMTTYNIYIYIYIYIYSGCYRFNGNMCKLLGQPQPKCFRLGLGEKKMCNLYFTNIFLKSFFMTTYIAVVTASKQTCGNFEVRCPHLFEILLQCRLQASIKCRLCELRLCTLYFAFSRMSSKRIFLGSGSIGFFH